MKKLACSLVLLALGGSAAAQPGETAPAPPAGPPEAPEAPPPPPMPPPLPPHATRAAFMSTGEIRFDVRIDGNAACTTPCALILEPLRFVTLHSQERSSSKLSVGYMPPGDVLVKATPRAEGAFVTGVTFTALSGMAVVTGITLTAVGCATERRGMCTAGLITGSAGGLGLYLSIELLLRSLPKLSVGAASPYVAGNSVGLAGRF
jgi:hypothetical protein